MITASPLMMTMGGGTHLYKHDPKIIIGNGRAAALAANMDSQCDTLKADLEADPEARAQAQNRRDEIHELVQKTCKEINTLKSLLSPK
jgi:hypothetical protein